MNTITVLTIVNADRGTVWDAWTTPADIMQWNHASDDWECPHAENDVQVGGKFSATMAAKDKSMSFDFNGVYTEVTPQVSLAYSIEDGRTVSVHFTTVEGGTEVTETFEMEGENSEEKQRAGWQAIMGNFKAHVEQQ